MLSFAMFFKAFKKVVCTENEYQLRNKLGNKYINRGWVGHCRIVPVCQIKWSKSSTEKSFDILLSSFYDDH